jgi:hypothetical protein
VVRLWIRCSINKEGPATQAKLPSNTPSDRGRSENLRKSSPMAAEAAARGCRIFSGNVSGGLIKTSVRAF